MAGNGSISQTASTFPNAQSRKKDSVEGCSRSSLSSLRGREHKGHALDLNENSPLLSPIRSHGDRASEDFDTPTGLLDWSDGQEEQSKSVFYLFILTLGIGGLQIAWATEMSYGSPYLLSLGLSKSLLAFVWIAGPLSGTLVQPYVGIRSDNCRIKYGKRRPFMLSGAFTTAISLLALAWAREIIHGFLGMFGADPESHGVKLCTIIWAIVCVWLLDFAINTVQAGVRAFIVDNAPTHQQEGANAWAGRIAGVGNILGYLSGYVHLPSIFPWLGHTQFQVLCSIACLALCGTVTVSCLYIRERDPRLEGPPPDSSPGVGSFFRQVFKSIIRLPPQIRKVCEVQFFNWIGWFGFLFYMTTYIGQLEVNPHFAANPHLTPEEVDQAWEDATRKATFALLIFAVTSFAANMLLPFVVVPSHNAPEPTVKTPLSAHHTPGTPGTLSASMSSFFPPAPSPSANLHTRLVRVLDLVQIPWLTLRRAWMLAHIGFALCMASTFFINTVKQATILTAFVGVPWALTLWAPFALISAEISKRDTEARKRGISDRGRTDIDGADNVIGEHNDQAGVILGLHNVAIAAPQMVATLVSSAIFKLAQKPRGEPYDWSVAWVLRFGGLAALVAAFLTWRVNEEADAGKGSKARRKERGTGEEEERLREGEVV